MGCRYDPHSEGCLPGQGEGQGIPGPLCGRRRPWPAYSRGVLDALVNKKAPPARSSAPAKSWRTRGNDRILWLEETIYPHISTQIMPQPWLLRSQNGFLYLLARGNPSNDPFLKAYSSHRNYVAQCFARIQLISIYSRFLAYQSRGDQMTGRLWWLARNRLTA